MPAYSKTPLHKKLGIKENDRISVYGFEGDYFQTLAVEKGDFRVPKQPKREQLDFIHLFTKDRKVLLRSIKKYKPFLSKKGMMWVSWPQGASGIPTDINREIVREELLAAGLVDIKVASFDDTWSGLKFMYRVKDR